MKDNLEQKIKDLRESFDLEEPNLGHFQRFEAKLSGHAKKEKGFLWDNKSWKWLSVAASLVLAIGIWFAFPDSGDKGMQLAEVSPEMEETQGFFVTTINKELETIKAQRTSENASIIDEALKNLEQLENDYKQLTLDLKQTADDKRIIYAMIANFQQRIEVLTLLLTQLDEIKQLKSGSDQA